MTHGLTQRRKDAKKARNRSSYLCHPCPSVAKTLPCLSAFAVKNLLPSPCVLIKIPQRAGQARRLNKNGRIIPGVASVFDLIFTPGNMDQLADGGCAIKLGEVSLAEFALLWKNKRNMRISDVRISLVLPEGAQTRSSKHAGFRLFHTKGRKSRKIARRGANAGGAGRGAKQGVTSMRPSGTAAWIDAGRTSAVWPNILRAG